MADMLRAVLGRRDTVVHEQERASMLVARRALQTRRNRSPYAWVKEYVYYRTHASFAINVFRSECFIVSKE